MIPKVKYLLIAIAVLSAGQRCHAQQPLEDLVLERLDRINTEWEALHKSFNAFFDRRWDSIPLQQGLWDLDITIKEKDDTLIATAKIPGINPDTLKISVEQNLLKISSYQTEKKDKSSSMQSYQMLRSLPYSVDVAASQATYKDETLIITMPRAKKRVSGIPIVKEEVQKESSSAPALESAIPDYENEKELAL